MVDNMKHIYIFLALLVLYTANSFAAAVEPDALECIIQNKKMGLRDRVSHKIIIPCKYDLIQCAGKELYKVKINGLWGIVNSAGKTIIAPKFNELGPFGNLGLATAKTAQKWGYINISGKFVIPEKYEEVVGFFGNNYATVKYNGKWGLIDKSDKVLIEFKYDNSLTFSDDYTRVCRDGLYGILHISGQESVPCKYTDAWFLDKKLLSVKKDGKWGFIDVNGNTVIPFDYLRTYDKFNNNTIGLDNESGAYILTMDARTIKFFPKKDIYLLQGPDDDNPETYYVIRQIESPNKKYIVNSKGERISSNDYQDVGFCYNNDMIKVKMDDKWGFINGKGTQVLGYYYDDVSLVYGGKGIAVKKGDKWGMIDITGNTIIPFDYDIIDQNYIYSKLIKDGKMGAVNSDCSIIIPVVYDDISYPDMRLGYFPVKKDGVDGYADFYGNDTF